MNSVTRSGAAARRFGTLLAAATFALASAAGADTAPTCWTPGGAPALFDWNSTPAIACRDGATVAGAGAILPGSGLGPIAAATTEADRAVPTTQVTFSGSAYVGVAVAF